METALQQFEQTAQKIFNRFTEELKTMRSSGATSQLLDGVMVEAYGARMKLIEVASIQAVDATLLVVTPWDKSLLQAVEKAIVSANLNLNPVVEGEMIRIVVPPLTEEKRKEIVKSLHARAEDSRVMLRTSRTDAKKNIEASEDADGVSEDDIRRELENLDKKAQEWLDKVATAAKQKEEQLLTL